MPKKCYNPEGIIQKLREDNVLLAQDRTTAETFKQLGVAH